MIVTSRENSPKTFSNQPSKASYALILSLILFSLLIIGTLDVSTVSADRDKVEKPTFSPSGGTYTAPQNVTIKCATIGATIHYTIDGSTPSLSSTAYNGPIPVSVSVTIKAKAFKTGMTSSDIASATYTIRLPKVATPTFSPVEGTYSSAQNVAIQCATSDATIRYTTSGAEPSPASTLYSDPILVNAAITIKARAFKNGMADSDIASATYKINLPRVAKPTFNPVNGTYSSPQSVTVRCATDDATVFYTIDGTEPSSSSTEYASPIPVSESLTIKAKASKTGMLDSETTSATYTIKIPPKVATPTFNPSGGTYSSSQSVAISCSTSDATIRYTTDGSDPTSSSTAYSIPVSVSSNTTIKAKAFKNGMTDSDTATATYIITTTNPQPQPSKVSLPKFSPTGGMYTSAQNVVMSCTTIGATIRYTTDGSEPSTSSTEYSGQILVSTTTTIKAKAFASGMTDSDTASATYAISVSGKVATPTFNPLAGSYSDAQSVAIDCATAGAVIRYTTSGLYPTSYSTVYSGPIPVNATTTIRAKAFMPGMADSEIGSATYIINAAASSQEPLFGLETSYAAIAIIATIAAAGGALLYLKTREKAT